ncbi:RICIN domain-containing protein [Microbacterium sp. G2-8]|uniref:RICIN domain-containing protein n=1 Tax=Microbacterium sp. G2-8 TaxID=2842454 RepID=UPI001C8A1E9A|nr:RICIN domain-containing protein [Microbacterium sp. G2-8]
MATRHALATIAVIATAFAGAAPASATTGAQPVDTDGTVPTDPEFSGPQVTEVRVLEEGRFVEIHWDRYVDEAEAVDPSNITVRNGEKTLALTPKPATGPTDTIFFDRENAQIAETAADSMARLPEDLHLASIAYTGTIDPDLPITVEIDGDPITDSEGRSARDAVFTGVPQLAYYTQSVITADGIEVKANDRVDADALDLAAAQIDVQLSTPGTGIAEQMVASGCSLAVYGARENAYLVPEHRRGYDPVAYDVEGFGGNDANGCVSSISERNVLRTRGDENPYLNTSYPDENILVHEFGHAVLSVGIEGQAEEDLADALFAAYENAYETGRWPNTYAISNRDEFFATLSTIWFDNMAEKPDWNDGVRSPINTRAELEAYDPVAYDFFASIYPDAPMPSPWDIPGPDVHHGDYRELPAQPERATAADVDYDGDAFRIVTESVGTDYQIDRYAGDPDHPDRDAVTWSRWGDGVWSLDYDGADGLVISASDGSGVLSAVSDTEVAYLGIARDERDPRQHWTFRSDPTTERNIYDGRLINDATGLALALDGRVGNGTSLMMADPEAAAGWMLEDTTRSSADGAPSYLLPVDVTVTSRGRSAELDAVQQGFTVPAIDDVGGGDWSHPRHRFAGWVLDGAEGVVPGDWMIPADATSVSLSAVWEKKKKGKRL